MYILGTFKILQKSIEISEVRTFKNRTFSVDTLREKNIAWMLRVLYFANTVAHI